jgi:hypothetical protein
LREWSEPGVSEVSEMTSPERHSPEAINVHGTSAFLPFLQKLARGADWLKK